MEEVAVGILMMLLIACADVIKVLIIHILTNHRLIIQEQQQLNGQLLDILVSRAKLIFSFNVGTGKYRVW